MEYFFGIILEFSVRMNHTTSKHFRHWESTSKSSRLTVVKKLWVSWKYATWKPHITGCLQINGAVSKVNKKFISHLTRAKPTQSAAATVQVSHALPAVRSLVLTAWCVFSKPCMKLTLYCNHRCGHLKTEHTESLSLLRRHLGNWPRSKYEKLGQLPLLTVYVVAV